MIDIKKRYVTRDNKHARILAVDAKHLNYPVIALIDACGYEVITRYTSLGELIPGEYSPYNLIEYKPENDYVLDQKIYVRNYETDKWAQRHFSKLNAGIVHTWMGGLTSWSKIGAGYTIIHAPWQFHKPLET